MRAATHRDPIAGASPLSLQRSLHTATVGVLGVVFGVAMLMAGPIGLAAADPVWVAGPQLSADGPAPMSSDDAISPPTADAAPDRDRLQPLIDTALGDPAARTRIRTVADLIARLERSGRRSVWLGHEHPADIPLSINPTLAPLDALLNAIYPRGIRIQLLADQLVLSRRSIAYTLPDRADLAIAQTLATGDRAKLQAAWLQDPSAEPIRSIMTAWLDAHIRSATTPAELRERLQSYTMFADRSLRERVGWLTLRQSLPIDRTESWDAIDTLLDERVGPVAEMAGDIQARWQRDPSAAVPGAVAADRAAYEAWLRAPSEDRLPPQGFWRVAVYERLDVQSRLRRAIDRGRSVRPVVDAVWPWHVPALVRQLRVLEDGDRAVFDAIAAAIRERATEAGASPILDGGAGDALTLALQWAGSVDVADRWIKQVIDPLAIQEAMPMLLRLAEEGRLAAVEALTRLVAGLPSLIPEGSTVASQLLEQGADRAPALTRAACRLAIETLDSRTVGALRELVANPALDLSVREAALHALTILDLSAAAESVGTFKDRADDPLSALATTVHRRYLTIPPRLAPAPDPAPAEDGRALVELMPRTDLDAMIASLRFDPTQLHAPAALAAIRQAYPALTVIAIAPDTPEAVRETIRAGFADAGYEPVVFTPLGDRAADPIGAAARVWVTVLARDDHPVAATGSVRAAQSGPWTVIVQPTGPLEASAVDAPTDASRDRYRGEWLARIEDHLVLLDPSITFIGTSDRDPTSALIRARDLAGPIAENGLPSLDATLAMLPAPPSGDDGPGMVEVQWPPRVEGATPADDGASQGNTSGPSNSGSSDGIRRPDRPFPPTDPIPSRARPYPAAATGLRVGFFGGAFRLSEQRPADPQSASFLDSAGLGATIDFNLDEFPAAPYRLAATLGVGLLTGDEEWQTRQNRLSLFDLTAGIGMQWDLIRPAEPTDWTLRIGLLALVHLQIADRTEIVTSGIAEPDESDTRVWLGGRFQSEVWHPTLFADRVGLRIGGHADLAGGAGFAWSLQGTAAVVVSVADWFAVEVVGFLGYGEWEISLGTVMRSSAGGQLGLRIAF